MQVFLTASSAGAARTRVEITGVTDLCSQADGTDAHGSACYDARAQQIQLGVAVMNEMTLTKRVDAPLEDTFAIFSDLDRAAHHISGIVRIERDDAGPMKLGTRWGETRVMMNREATETLEVTAFVPNEYYTVVCDSCGSNIASTFRFVPRGSGTDVLLELEVTPNTLMAKMLAPLGKFMLEAMRACMQQDMDELARVAEEAAAGHAVSAAC
ncbi:MAG: hypothetical protein ACI9EF_001907 [Pseudohongiellaceae bacterium]|jgi:hypothetical protein